MKENLILRFLCVTALLALPGLVAAQGMKIPRSTSGLMPNAATGKPLFEMNCGGCHGVDLRGTDKGPPLLHRIYEPSHHADIAFQMAVANGARQHHWKFGDMAPVPGLSPDDVAHITAWVRAVQRKVGIR